MDPISAFSLAVNILTVVDLSAKVIATISEIRSSGDTISNKELAADAQRLKSYCQKFSLRTATTSTHQNAALSISSDDDATLRLLASEAKGIADDIQDNLLKLNKQRSFMRVFRQSIRNTRKEPEMKRKAERLKEMQDKIIFSIIVSINSSVDTLTLKNDEALARLDENTRSLIQTILSENEVTRAKMETQVSNLQADVTKNHVETMDSASQRHDELLCAIRVGPAQNETSEGENETEYKERVAETILDKLWFSRINDRHEDIKPAHQRTFEWIFSAEIQLKSSCSFFQWVEEGSGLYWISGRAGSGKSTLMKFLADHENTEALLQQWTKGRDYIMATYWFWDQSTDALQKSMEGLYRGLLYKVIKRETSLASLLFPDQFNPGRQWQLDFPTSNELRRAFNRLVSMEASPVLVVLLIDGLDEYEATEIEQLSLAESLKNAAQSKHMKIIASSRPETVFEQAFENCDKLYLHDLTYSDQTHFTEDNLYKHTRMKYLAGLTGGKKDADELIHSAVEKSEGIFLWLRLVVNLLVQELDACDTINDLQNILTQFPPGLEKLFLHMMGRIREDRRERGFLGLLVAQRALWIHLTQSPSINPTGSKVQVSRTMERYKFALTVICLAGAYTDLDKVTKLEAEPLSDAVGRDTIRKVENRLRSWSGGLLELGTPCSSVRQTAGKIETRLRSLSAGLSRRGSLYSDLEVRFLHRSIAEFLDLPSTRAHIINTISCSAFDVDLALMNGLLVKIKREVDSWGFGESTPLWDFAELILRIARHIEEVHTDAVTVVLEELDRTLTSVFNKSTKGLQYWTDHFPWERKPNRISQDHKNPVTTGRRTNFLSIAVESGLAVFALKQLGNPEKQHLVKALKGVPLLSLACRPPPFSFMIPGIIRPEIIRKLLELGADPNQRYKNGEYSLTPWECMLQTAMDLRVVSIHGAEQLSDILTMLIKSGADLDVTIPVDEWGDSNIDIVPLVVVEDVLDVEDVVCYAFLHSIPRCLGDKVMSGSIFWPFQKVDETWKMLGYGGGEQYYAGTPRFLFWQAAAADKETIKEMGHRLLELIRTKRAECSYSAEQGQQQREALLSNKSNANRRET